MAVDNRLIAEQLAGLGPGEPVTIEFVRDFRRPEQVAGTVVRPVGSRIVVSCRVEATAASVTCTSSLPRRPERRYREPH